LPGRPGEPTVWIWSTGAFDAAGPVEPSDWIWSIGALVAWAMELSLAGVALTLANAFESFAAFAGSDCRQPPAASAAASNTGKATLARHLIRRTSIMPLTLLVRDACRYA
jgi:hypothetical protein